MTDVATSASLSLADRIRELVNQDKLELPPLPELALRLRELLADEDKVDARSVADLVRNDAAVSAALLRFANSAAFGGLNPITELGPAIARLGLPRVSSLITAMEMQSQFKTDNPNKGKVLQVLWDHSVAVGFSSRRLAQRGDDDAEEAFLAGLLHDCGRLLVLKGVDCVQDLDSSFEITGPVLDELMDSLNCELGYLTLSSWKLPESICNVARDHAKPSRSDDPSILTYVQAADAIARKMGFDSHPDPEMNLTEESSMELLELREIELATLMVDLEDEFKEVRELF